MNKSIFFILYFMGLALMGLAQNPHICKMDDVIQMERERNKAKVDFLPNAVTADYDLKYHRLHWKVDPAVKYIQGTITTYFESKSPDLSVIHFDLGDSMQVNTVRQRGQELNFDRLGNNILAVDLSQPLVIGELDSIEINYEGEPTNTGFSSFNADMHDGVPVLWTLSQPYGAKDWWPCKQSLNDKIDSIDIIVECPMGNKVGSNGLLISVDTLPNDQLSFHWKHRYPIPAYLIAIAVSNYEEFSHFADLSTGDSLEILNYVYPESRDRAEADLEFIVPMMELFNDLFGDYPFSNEKYGHMEFEFGGGMEHQTMSSMGGYSFVLQAHELAHQWFGDKVTCGSWKDIWINEGFATYLTGIATENLNPDFWEGWKVSHIERVTSEPGGTTYVTDTSSIASIFSSRLTYFKGALILHQLRWIMGDELFFQACRELLNDPNHAFGYVNTDQFQGILSRVYGSSLEEYFNDYVYGSGYPSFQLKWEQSNDAIHFLLDQTTSDPSVDFFEMIVPVRVYSGGTDTTFRLGHEFSLQRFKYDFSKQVDSIKIDPDLWLISKDNTVEEDFISQQYEPLDEVGQIFPVPTKDQLFIRLSKDTRKAIVTVYDAAGTRVLRTSLSNGTGVIATQDWKPGSYWLTLEVEGSKYSKQFPKL